MNARVWLMCEDEFDAEVVKLIVQKKLLPVQIQFVALIGNKRGIVGLAHDLERLIEATQQVMDADDCIAVLIDTEFNKPLHNRHEHKRIAKICQQKQEQVALILAIQEIEAWLLADSGICRYLGEQPANYDRLPDPKEHIASILWHKKRRKWGGFDRNNTIRQMNGDGDIFSPSLRKALQQIHDHLKRRGLE